MIHSYTSLSIYASCPYRYYLRYYLRKKEPITQPLALGKAVHKAIQTMIETDSTLEEAIHAGLIEADFYPLNRMEIEWLVLNASAQPGMGETEVYFCLLLSDKPDSPQLQGYIDLVGDGWLIDWKTNRDPSTAINTMQMPLYAWALLQMKPLIAIQATLYFLRYKYAASKTYTKASVEPARIWAYNTALTIEKKFCLLDKQIEKSHILFPAKPSATCKHCGFAWECYRNHQMKGA